MRCWDGYERVPGTIEGTKGSCRKSTRKSPVKKRTSPPIKRKHCKSPKRCNNSSKKRRKSKKTSVKRRKSKKTSIKRRKSKKTSVKRRKSKKTFVKRRKSKKTSPKKRKYKKKTNIQEALYLRSNIDGPLIRISPPNEKSAELKSANIIESEAAKKLEMIESLIGQDSNCKKYIENPYLTMPLEEKNRLKNELLQKISNGGTLSKEDDDALEYLVDAITADPEEVKKKETFGIKWVEKYMMPVKDGLSQGEFWYKQISQFVLSDTLMSYNTMSTKRIPIYENISRSTNIIDSATGQGSESWQELMNSLCDSQENGYNILDKIMTLKKEVEKLDKEIGVGKVTDQKQKTEEREEKKNELNETMTELDNVYKKIYEVKFGLTELISSNNSLSENLETYWETPMSVLLPNNKTVKSVFENAKQENPLILSDFDSSSLNCDLKQVKNLEKYKLFENEPSMDCSIAKQAFKLKILANNMSTDPLLVFKSIDPVKGEKKKDDLPYKLKGDKFYQKKGFETLASFIRNKDINLGTQMPKGGMTKCELLALYYFLTNVATPVDKSFIPKILEMITRAVDISADDDDFRDPEIIIEKMKENNQDPDLFYRALYLTMPIPKDTSDIMKIYKGLEISDNQFLQYEKSGKARIAAEKLKETFVSAKTALEDAIEMEKTKDYEGASELLNGPTRALVQSVENATKAGVEPEILDKARDL